MEIEHNTEIQRKAFDSYMANVNYARYRKVYKILRNLKKGSLLEVGCSGGEFLDLLKKDGWNVKGLEISEKATKRANERGIDVKVHDANKKLPFKDGSFDVVFAGELIEHVFDDVGFINECHRVLREGGLLIITTPNLISLKNRFLMLFGYDPRYSVTPFHYHVYTKNIFGKMFRKSKFKNIKFSGNFIIYSKNRDPIFGSLFEWIGGFLPALSEHFVITAKR